MKRAFILLMLFVLPVFDIIPAVVAQTELAATVIEIDEWREYVPQPISIVGLKYGDNIVASGENFQAPPSWIKDLSVRIKNVSSQTLKYVEVTVNFPRDANDSPILAQVSLSKGFPYIITTKLPTSDQLSLSPGEEVELSVSESAYKAFEWNVKTASPPSSLLRSAKVKTEAVAFSPNRIWMRGAYLDRDPQTPGRWVVDQEEQDRIIRRMQIQKQGLTLKRIGFNPVVFSTVHVVGGCFRWNDAEVLYCSGTGCTTCTVGQDKSRDTPIGDSRMAEKMLYQGL